MTRLQASLALAGAALVLGAVPSPVAGLHPRLEPPPGCRPYSPAGDYACAGLELRYHTAGTAAATSDQWAGQWLFTDDQQRLRLGSCTFNRGLHPRADDPAEPVSQAFPNDPGHVKSAYLTWRYGATTDDLTAAALWALFHFYAQDAAGSTRAIDPASPLVPSLDLLAAASGRDDLQRLAIDLDAEAARFGGPFALDGRVENGAAVVTVTANGIPVPGVTVTVDATPLVTDAAGQVTAPIAEGSTIHVVAAGPGVPGLYLADPLRPHAFGGQSLITAGPPSATELTLTAPVADTTTTSTTSTSTTSTTSTSTTSTSTTTTTTTRPPVTTTPPPPTTAPTTTTSTPITTTDASTTTTAALTTPPPTTDAPTTSVVSVAPPVPPSPPPASPASPASPATLPKTGSAKGVAAAAALVLGAGVGALVGLRRRMRVPGAATGDGFWS